MGYYINYYIYPKAGFLSFQDSFVIDVYDELASEKTRDFISLVLKFACLPAFSVICVTLDYGYMNISVISQRDKM